MGHDADHWALTRLAQPIRGVDAFTEFLPPDEREDHTRVEEIRRHHLNSSSAARISSSLCSPGQRPMIALTPVVLPCGRRYGLSDGPLSGPGICDQRCKSSGVASAT